MQQQAKIEDCGSCPSFSCYSSDGLASMAAAKVIGEEQQASRFHEFDGVDGEDFEFSVVLSDEEVSLEEIDMTVFPVFNREFPVKDGVDREIKAKTDEIDVSASITGTLRKLFIDEHEESSSYSSSEADELENVPSGTYCVWRPKVVGGIGSSSLMTKCKKSSSTGSGSKRWRIRYFLRRSNSEGKEPMLFVTSKKIDNPKQKRNSGEVSKASRRLKSQTPVHEQFYVQKRAENEIVKRKSYLPYRQDLVGFFANHNRIGKMLPF